MDAIGGEYPRLPLAVSVVQSRITEFIPVDYGNPAFDHPLAQETRKWAKEPPPGKGVVELCPMLEENLG